MAQPPAQIKAWTTRNRKKKTKLDRAVDRAAEIILKQLDAMPIEAANENIKQLDRLAAKSCRAAKSEKGRSQLDELRRFVLQPDPTQELHKLPLVPVLIDLS